MSKKKLLVGAGIAVAVVAAALFLFMRGAGDGKGGDTGFINDYVSINSSSPTSQLTIVGVAGVNPVSISSSSGDLMFTILKNGNVGIGVASPGNLLTITPSGTYSSSQSAGGAVNLNNSKNGREALVVYNDTTGVAVRNGAMIRLENVSTTQSTGMLRINSLATGGGDYDIRIDSPNPDIEFTDLDFAEPGASVEIDAGPVTGTSTVAGLRFNLRNDANTSFVNMGGFRRLNSNKGMMYLVPGTAGLSIGWQDDFLDWSLGPIQVNSNATSPSTIDLTNSIAVGTGTGGVNATSKFLGQFGWVSRDSSFTTPKIVAYIGAEGTETYAADADVGSQIKFYTGTINNTVATEKMVISDTGRLGIGTSTPLAVLTVSASSSNANAPILFEVASSTQTSLFRILGNGNVGINTTTPSTLFAVDGGTSTFKGNIVTVNGGYNNNSYGFINDSQSGMHLNSVGQLALNGGFAELLLESGIFKPGTTNQIDLGQEGSAWKDVNASGTVRLSGIFPLTVTGNLVCQSTTGTLAQQAANCTVSSARFKEHIESMSTKDLMDKVRRLRAVNFDFKEGSIPTSGINGGGKESSGFIAEEVAMIDPMLVVFTSNYSKEEFEFVETYYKSSILYKNGSALIPQTVDYSRVSVLLTGALQNVDERLMKLEKLLGQQ